MMKIQFGIVDDIIYYEQRDNRVFIVMSNSPRDPISRVAIDH